MTTKAGVAAQFLQSLKLGKSDYEALSSMLADAEISLKAMPHSENDSMPMVQDRWNKGEMHAVPSAETIKVGPSQSASGGGAEHMVKQYSNDTPQKGIQLEAERLAGELHALAGAAKALQEGHNGLCKSFDTSMVAISKGLDTLTDQNRRFSLVIAGLLQKAEHEEGDDDEEKEEKIEINASKAQASYAKARALLKKSRSIKAQMKANSDASHQTALKAQAKLYKKAAQAYFSKAAHYATAGKARAVITRKALDEFFAANPALKSDFDENVNAGSLAKAAKKARADWKTALKAATIKKDDDAGNQDDKKDGETGNQDDSAAKSAEALASAKAAEQRVTDALSGLGMMQADVKQLIETISGRSVTNPVAPLQLAKSADPQDQIAGYLEKIETLSGQGRLDQASANRARDVVGKMDARNKGAMSDAQFNAYYEAAPKMVKDVFQMAA